MPKAFDGVGREECGRSFGEAQSDVLDTEWPQAGNTTSWGPWCARCAGLSPAKARPVLELLHLALSCDMNDKVSEQGLWLSCSSSPRVLFYQLGSGGVDISSAYYVLGMVLGALSVSSFTDR